MGGGPPCRDLHLSRPEVIFAPIQLQRFGGVPDPDRLQRAHQTHRVPVCDLFWYLKHTASFQILMYIIVEDLTEDRI
jgi:hypothetical protein